MTIKWGKDAQPSKADQPRKPRGSERPGHSHEQVVITALLVYLALLCVIGFGAWVYRAPVGSEANLNTAGTLFFAIAAVSLIATALWLLLDLRTPILLGNGAGSVMMLVLGFSSPVFFVVFVTALFGVYAGLNRLELHPRDRWTCVVVSIVFAIALGQLGLLLFIPVAIAAGIVPEFDFGPAEGE